MNLLRSLGGLALVMVVAVGCSRTNDYVPEEMADGQAIFEMACAGCHEPISEGIVYEMSSEKATLEKVKLTIREGDFPMPGFPNIKGEQLDQLGQYVLSVNRSQ